MYELCPFLFWTIVVISRQVTPLTPTLQKRLTEEYASIARKEAFRVPLPLTSIQALIYLCTWPLPVARQTEDPSWTYCGIISSASLYMGLNHPASQQPLRSLRVAPGDHQTRSKTWLAYFLTSTL